MPMWHKYSLPPSDSLDKVFFFLDLLVVIRRSFYCNGGRKEHLNTGYVSEGFLSLQMKRYRLLLFGALQKNCSGNLEPNPLVLFLGRFNFRQEPKISLSPETHEYLDQRITHAEINLRQNKILQNIKYILITNKYNIQSLVL